MERYCHFSWLVRPWDTKDEAKIKTMVFPFALVAFLHHVFEIFLVVLTTGQTVSLLGQLIMSAGFLFFLLGAFTNVMRAGITLDITLGLCTLGTCMVDLGAATISSTFRASVFVVLLLDAILVFKRDHMSYLVIGFVLLYMTVMEAESFHKFGMYEVGYWGSPGIEISYCNCASPPCSSTAGVAFINLFSMFLVCLGDFYFTRGFATGMRLQLRRVEALVVVAGDVAAALARYDVDEAEEAIAKGEHLPEELRESYIRLVSNLHRYRAYLPHSCLVDDAPEVDNTPEADTQESDKSSMDVEDLHTDSQSSLESRENIPPGVQPEQWKAVKRSTRDRTSYEGRGRRADSLGSTPFKRKVKNNRSKALAVKPRRARVSLAAGNMLGYLNQERSLMGAHNTKWIESDVECWCAAVISSRGVVDLIGGDRRYASFNARKQCVGHASAAIGVLISRGAVECTGCVVSGQVVCGTYGCSTAMRFMVLGGVASSLHPFERIAARWKLRVLTDQVAYNLARFQWRGKLLAALFLTKRTECAINVYTITDRKDGSNSPGQDLVVLENEDEPENKPAAEAIAARLAKVDAESARQTSQKDPLGDWVLRVREVGLDIL
eukprot:Hpha_TRINITY_DN15119_c3_g1::TRINITY_DN15119_c3_g1_i2::g.126766::m.126766